MVHSQGQPESWVIIMVIVVVPFPDRVVGQILNGHSWLINGGDPITTEPSTGSPSSKLGEISGFCGKVVVVGGG